MYATYCWFLEIFYIFLSITITNRYMEIYNGNPYGTRQKKIRRSGRQKKKVFETFNESKIQREIEKTAQEIVCIMLPSNFLDEVHKPLNVYFLPYLYESFEYMLYEVFILYFIYCTGCWKDLRPNKMKNTNIY